MKAKKLLLENGYAKTYWGKRIINAEARGCFSEEDIHKSSDFFTCSNGGIDSHIDMDVDELDGYPRPADNKIYDLELSFFYNVFKHDFLASAQTLIDIENRSLELLKESLNES
jgi:hypothetical protein